MGLVIRGGYLEGGGGEIMLGVTLSALPAEERVVSVDATGDADGRYLADATYDFTFNADSDATQIIPITIPVVDDLIPGDVVITFTAEVGGETGLSAAAGATTDLAGNPIATITITDNDFPPAAPSHVLARFGDSVDEIVVSWMNPSRDSSGAEFPVTQSDITGYRVCVGDTRDSISDVGRSCLVRNAGESADGLSGGAVNPTSVTFRQPRQSGYEVRYVSVALRNALETGEDEAGIAARTGTYSPPIRVFDARRFARALLELRLYGSGEDAAGVGELSPPFHPDVHDYTVTIGGSPAALLLELVADDGVAGDTTDDPVITVTRDPPAGSDDLIPSESAPDAVLLRPRDGRTTYTITVTPADGSPPGIYSLTTIKSPSSNTAATPHLHLELHPPLAAADRYVETVDAGVVFTVIAEPPPASSLSVPVRLEGESAGDDLSLYFAADTLTQTVEFAAGQASVSGVFPLAVDPSIDSRIEPDVNADIFIPADSADPPRYDVDGTPVPLRVTNGTRKPGRATLHSASQVSDSLAVDLRWSQPGVSSLEITDWDIVVTETVGTATKTATVTLASPIRPDDFVDGFYYHRIDRDDVVFGDGDTLDVGHEYEFTVAGENVLGEAAASESSPKQRLQVQPVLSLSPASVGEGHRITATMTLPVAAGRDIRYPLAITPADLLSGDTTITIAAGATTGSVTLTALTTPDTTTPVTATIALDTDELSVAAGVRDVAGVTADLTITPSGSTVSIATDASEYTEGDDAAVTVTVTVTPPIAAELAVNLGFGGGGGAERFFAAEDLGDVSTPIVVTVPAMAASVERQFAIVDDDEMEEDAVLSVGVLPGDGYVIAEITPLTVTIANDDLPPSPVHVYAYPADDAIVVFSDFGVDADASVVHEVCVLPVSVADPFATQCVAANSQTGSASSPTRFTLRTVSGGQTISNGEQYRLAVRAVQGAFASAWVAASPALVSPTATARPLPPIRVNVTAQSNRLDVNAFFSGIGTEPSRVDFCVVTESETVADCAADRILETGYNPAPSHSAVRNNISVVGTPISNGNTYRVFARAKHGNGDSDWLASTPATVTPQVPPGRPRQFTAGGGDRAIELSWLPANSGSAPDAYEVCFGSDLGSIPDGRCSAYDNRATIVRLPPSATTHTLRDGVDADVNAAGEPIVIQNDTEYTILLRALRAGLSASDYAKQTVTPMVALPPGKVRNLVVVPGQNQVIGNWDAPTTGSPVDSYQVCTALSTAVSAVEFAGETEFQCVTLRHGGRQRFQRRRQPLRLGDHHPARPSVAGGGAGGQRCRRCGRMDRA